MVRGRASIWELYTFLSFFYKLKTAVKNKAY